MITIIVIIVTVMMIGFDGRRGRSLTDDYCYYYCYI